jgi:hypothetical protein
MKISYNAVFVLVQTALSDKNLSFKIGVWPIHGMLCIFFRKIGLLEKAIIL